MSPSRRPPGKKARRPSFIVGIGGSAGSLDAYKEFLEALRPDTGMAFVFVTHILPTATSQLAELLSYRTPMPVLVAADGMRVEANRVYVSPPNVDLRVVDGSFKVTFPRTRANDVVDVFFASMAAALGARAIGVVVSGWDEDGTAGCLLIKEKKGVVFAQDMSATVSGMPLSVQAAGCVDFVMTPSGIAKKLGAMADKNPRRRA